MTHPEDEYESSGRNDDYPVDDLEREAHGLPPLSNDRRERPVPPGPVQLSFWLWVAAAALLVVGFVLMVGNQAEIIESLLDSYERARLAGDPVTERSGVTPENIATGVPGLLWLLAAGAVMIAGLIVLFAYKAREGTRSARSVLIALTLAVAAFAIGMPGEFVNFFHVIALGVAAVAIVLLFLPSVAAFFPRLPRVKRRWQDYS